MGWTERIEAIEAGKTSVNPLQGVTLAALGKPLLICAEPPDLLRIELGRESLAAEVRELLVPFAV